MRSRWQRPRPAALVAALLAAAAIIAAITWVVLGSSWLRVEQIRVVGTERTDPAAVQLIADETLSTPLARVDTSRLARRVSGLPLVASAIVTRQWPSTLVVQVRDRQAVAAVAAPRGGVDLVDEQGVTLAHADVAPPGVPTLEVTSRAGRDAVVAALAVNTALPDAIRQRAVTISATGPDSVVVTLRDGPEIRWGGSDRGERKGEVVLRMLAEPAIADSEVMDVSAPDAPAVTP